MSLQMIRLGVLILGIALQTTAAESTLPALDISPHSSLFSALRRLQSLSGSNLPAQSFPLSSASLEDAGGMLQYASPYDVYTLRYGFPLEYDPLVKWSGKGNQFFLSPGMEAAYLVNNDSTGANRASLGGVGLRLYGGIGEQLSFFSHGMVYTEKTNRAQFSHQFDPDLGETYSVEKGPGDSLLPDRSYNRYRYYLYLQLPWLDIKVGRDHVHLGPGYFSNLTATRDTPPYYLMEARVDFAPWLYMDNYILRMVDSEHSILKYGHVHRFEFRPRSDLSIAFQDIVIYQQREIDWKYVLPLTPLAFSEDNTGGRDNDAMACDIVYSGIPYASLWGELFIDDLLGPGSFFDDFWENRWAVLWGAQFVSPLDMVDADLIVEYSRVEPWTYNGRQDYTSFRHFNVPSASRLGPDSESWDIQLSYRPLKYLQIREHLALLADGTGAPGTLGVIHSDSKHGTSKQFLGTGVERNSLLEHSLELVWQSKIHTRFSLTQDLRAKEVDAYGVSFVLVW